MLYLIYVFFYIQCFGELVDKLNKNKIDTFSVNLSKSSISYFNLIFLGGTQIYRVGYERDTTKITIKISNKVMIRKRIKKIQNQNLQYLKNLMLSSGVRFGKLTDHSTILR